ncbi:MarR family transcriptional regulator [Acuticoccus sp. MNP-M23]|uniref:MarR family winged helix-turn-helix transcriptional regulator n=1 Tax=Acuticoccus sp. MNP-M23 TaxID=3072793 RepID=UPI002815F4A0|nr:MarR family transcriptional regulator [Acuticoccus sp. MNP-M23]WMS42624.1 MarR family transcriptional regulator [Acuticoccus sp. MNP-M23]
MDQRVAPESRASEGADALRLWLRLFATANQVEAELSRRLRAEFQMTLPRFDLMAQLAKAGEGVTLGELSRRLMVTNGNVTGLVDRLAEDGLVERKVRRADRRSATVRLTHEGAQRFADMAKVHRGWIEELFDGVDPESRTHLSALLKTARDSVAERT